jgi:hypothetical protein
MSQFKIIAQKPIEIALEIFASIFNQNIEEPITRENFARRVLIHLQVQEQQQKHSLIKTVTLTREMHQFQNQLKNSHERISVDITQLTKAVTLADDSQILYTFAAFLKDVATFSNYQNQKTIIEESQQAESPRPDSPSSLPIPIPPSYTASLLAAQSSNTF